MKAAVYARISVKHRNRKDLSIDAQIAVCRQLFSQKRITEEIALFRDVGWSGREWNRPAFLLLREQICKGEISCVAVKDFSRLGRDYRKVGGLVERFFPQHGVRFLSAAEKYDSAERFGNQTAAGLYHLLNEWYAKDIGRKVSIVKREQKEKGNYLGSVAPYGFQIVKKDGVRVLEPDESCRILQEMLRRQQLGYSSEEIADWLFLEKVNPPSVYRKTGKVLQEEGSAMRWQSGTIRRLLAAYRKRG